MKITIVQGAFLPVPPLMGGAVEKVWFALGEEFSRQGHQVTHLSRRHTGLPVRESLNGVTHVRVSGFDAPRSLLLLKALDLAYSWRVLRSLPPADILVTNTFWLPILARKPSLGRIYVHVARYPKGQIRFYSRAARLQTVSHSVADAIKLEAPGLANRVSVIPYPLVGEGFTNRQTVSVHDKEKLILFTGRIHPEKGLDLLIRALVSLPKEQLAPWRVAIIGPTESRQGGGGQPYLHELQVLARPLGRKIEWLGPIFDSGQLAAMYHRAAIFVYPSIADRGETFGLAPLEAMSHGCAPIVSDLKCFRDFVDADVDGLVFNHSADQAAIELAKCLSSLMSDDRRRAALSAGALKKAQHFEVERIANLFQQDFDSLVLPQPS